MASDIRNDEDEITSTGLHDGCSTERSCENMEKDVLTISERTKSSIEKQPSGINNKQWERFKALKKRRQEISKKSTEKRVKKLKEDIMKKVEREFTNEEDIDILKKHTIDIQCSSPKEIKLEEMPSSIQTVPKPNTQVQNEEKWKGVQKYIGCNNHIKGIDKGKYAPKTTLEEEIDSAIATGNYEKAEEMSDYLAKREFGKTVADAFDAKKYADNKEEEKKAKEQKKRKLYWGFDHKQRWETKSNM